MPWHIRLAIAQWALKSASKVTPICLVYEQQHEIAMHHTTKYKSYIDEFDWLIQFEASFNIIYPSQNHVLIPQYRILAGHPGKVRT